MIFEELFLNVLEEMLVDENVEIIFRFVGDGEMVVGIMDEWWNEIVDYFVF